MNHYLYEYRYRIDLIEQNRCKDSQRDMTRKLGENQKGKFKKKQIKLTP